MSHGRQPEVECFLFWRGFAPFHGQENFTFYVCGLTLQTRWRRNTPKSEKYNFRLTSVAQKRLCLSSLISLETLRFVVALKTERGEFKPLVFVIALKWLNNTRLAPKEKGRSHSPLMLKCYKRNSIKGTMSAIFSNSLISQKSYTYQ